ncbi:MAG: IPT/TIG domain-containing protein [Bryobacteraceae bacterium]
MTIRQLLMPLTLGVLSLSCAWGQQYVINTYAGNRTAGFSGDGGAPASAQFDLPLGLALDSSGNLFIVDSVNQRIRKISGGAISTVAGNGTNGYSGDGKAATSAEMLYPSAVAVDSSGNLYIADTSNHVIRMVTSSGTISTIAGTNTGGYSGDTGPAIDAELDFPTGVAVDGSGNVYIADSGNNVIREISGGNINTIVGGSATAQQLNDPETVLVDSSGNLYFSDQSGFRIMKFSAGAVTVIAGNGNIGYSGDNGPAIDAALDEPSGIALDAQGYLYICDTDNSVIRKVSPSGIITTIAGLGTPGYFGDGGPGTGALLFFPRGIVVDASGNVYVSDTGNDIVRVLQPQKPSISSGGVVNAASFTAQLSPGALATVFGSNFTGTGVAAVGPLPLAASLGGVSVQVNGVAAPVLYASSNQINFQIPWETPTGSVTVAVGINGLASPAVNVTVQAAAPGLFVQGSHAIVQNSPDFSLNSASDPAKVGSTIVAYLTGAGAVSPQPADGVGAGSGSNLSTVTPTVTATIGGTTATVSFAGLAPSFVGLWQANIVVPSGLTQGDFPLTVSVGGQTSNSGNVSVTP